MQEEGNNYSKGGEFLRATEVLKGIEKCIQAFWSYIKSDNVKTMWKCKRIWRSRPPVQDPQDLHLLYTVTEALHKCQCRPSRVLSPLVFFPISTHFTAPPKIPSVPTVLQLGSFHRLSKVEPWDLAVDLKSHLQTLYAQSFRITLASSVLPAAVGTELADAYSPVN
ncbi:hypothetical protein Salat_1388700 [Sesamum alatum]|uniref:Uncharacterized protein n=1 Tax=Sesamum alatum TaxID=300844 RepID=A0AAE1Y9Y2_9LAMI|nr:hypothetical protein Salat_1388700 [Sesamum alatum]